MLEINVLLYADAFLAAGIVTMTMTVVIIRTRRAVFRVNVLSQSSAAVMVDVFVEFITVMVNITVMTTVMKMTATPRATKMNFSAKTHITAYLCKLRFHSCYITWHFM
jgi:hypothetical protein